LPVLEDWHFWLQLTAQADLVHCPGVSAVYRQGLGQSSLGDAQHPHHWRVWHRRLLRQWVQGRPLALGGHDGANPLPEDVTERVTDTLAWHAVELDRTQAAAAAQAQALQQAAADLHHARSLAAQHQAARDALQRELEAFSRESQAALAAKDAALQIRASEAARQLAEREAQAQRFAAQAQRELDASQARLHQQAGEQALLLQAKEAELQRFGQEACQALEAKEAQLQRVAADAKAALDIRDTEHAAQRRRLEEALAEKQSEAGRLRAELAAVHASRSWRWTAPLRRGRGGAGGAGA
jgi:hypothetical protein